MSGHLKSEIKRELVQRAENAFKEAKKKPGYEAGIKEATAQLRNLVQITQQETEISVLENFLQYQRGRDATKKFWNLIYGEVLAALHWIRDHEDLDDEAKKAAVQNYFGYLVRHYVYLEAIRKEEEATKKKNEEARRAAQGGARR